MPRRSAALLVFVASALVASTSRAAAASTVAVPSPVPTTPPSARASGEPEQGSPGVAWLDAPLPMDAAPGSTITVAALLTQGAFVGIVRATPVFRLQPASGHAAATITSAIPDWPGHYVARLVVPAGGVGELTIAIPGTLCENDVCSPSDFPFPIRVGPPTDLPLPLITTATLDVADTTPLAGRPFEVAVDIHPRVAWPTAMALPAALTLEVKVPQGPVAAEVPLTQATGGRYAGPVTIDQPGDYVVQVATQPRPAMEDLYGTALRRITVQPAVAAPGPAPVDGGLAVPDWWPAAGAGALLVLALVLVLGGRRGSTTERPD